MPTKSISIKEDNGVVKEIGYIHQQIFYKKVDGKKHLYEKKDAWGIDAQVFNTIILIECKEIKILDYNEDVLYSCTVGHFDSFSEYLHHKPHRSQRLMARPKFNITKDYMKNKNQEKQPEIF